MPALTINTNVEKGSIPSSLNKDLTDLLSKILGKPEKYIAVHINPDQMLTFAGTSEPAALCSLVCIGKQGLEENKSHTAAIMDKLKTDLGIPMDRMYLNFYDPKRQDVGWNGTTFAWIMENLSLKSEVIL